MDDFIISLKFHPKGNVDGSFLFHTDKGDKVSDIKYGLFLNRDREISFTFGLDWWIQESSSISTHFSGYLRNEDDEEFFYVDWLMVIECRETKDRYTKRGQFSSEKNIPMHTTSPFPSNIIGNMFYD